MVARSLLKILMCAASWLMLAGCQEKIHSIPAVEVSVSEDPPQLEDAFVPIALRSLRGVRSSDARKALEGDGAMAVAIGNAFADRNHVTEARYWFTVAAENGNSTGMAYLAIAERQTSCARANFWLRKALETGGLGRHSESSMRASLPKYESSCK